MKQRQLLEERNEEGKEKDNDLNMKNFLKNADNQHQRVKQVKHEVI